MKVFFIVYVTQKVNSFIPLQLKIIPDFLGFLRA